MCDLAGSADYAVNTHFPEIRQPHHRVGRQARKIGRLKPCGLYQLGAERIVASGDDQTTPLLKQRAEVRRFCHLWKPMRTPGPKDLGTVTKAVIDLTIQFKA